MRDRAARVTVRARMKRDKKTARDAGRFRIAWRWIS
jgi:hypothetical protein